MSRRPRMAGADPPTSSALILRPANGRMRTLTSGPPLPCRRVSVSGTGSANGATRAAPSPALFIQIIAVCISLNHQNTESRVRQTRQRYCGAGHTSAEASDQQCKEQNGQTPRQRLLLSGVRSRTVRRLGRGFGSVVSGAERSDTLAEASAKRCQEQNGQTPR